MSKQHANEPKITSRHANCIKFSVQQTENLMQFGRGRRG